MFNLLPRKTLPPRGEAEFLVLPDESDGGCSASVIGPAAREMAEPDGAPGKESRVTGDACAENRRLADRCPRGIAFNGQTKKDPGRKKEDDGQTQPLR